MIAILQFLCHNTVILCVCRLTCWAFNSLLWKAPWGRHPSVKTCERLIFGINCIVLSAPVGSYINCMNMHGMNNMKFLDSFLKTDMLKFHTAGDHICCLNMCLVECSYLYFIHSFSSLSYDRSKTSSKASSPHSAI